MAVKITGADRGILPAEQARPYRCHAAVIDGNEISKDMLDYEFFPPAHEAGASPQCGARSWNSMFGSRKRMSMRR